MTSRRAIDLNFQEAVHKHQLGELARAAVLYRKVLARAPAHPDALQLLGLIEAQAGKFAVAADLLGRSVRIRPEDGATWINYGNVLLGLQRPAEALAAYDRAISIGHADVAAYLNRGNALRDLGRSEEGLASYDEAHRLAPENADVLCNRGNALRDLNRPHEAIACYDRALSLDPEHADAYCNRGAAKRDLGRLDQAGSDCERALAINPGHAMALNNLGDVLAGQGRHAEAAAVFERLAEIAPDFDYALGYAHYARLRGCDWSGYDRCVQRLTEAVRGRKRVAVPFAFLAVSESPRDQMICAQTYVAHKFPTVPPALWSAECYRHERIRLAYLSADFHDHAVARHSVELFERHDRRRFEVIGVSYGPERQDSMRARLQPAFDRFLDVAAKSDREIAHLLRSMEVDIAVDLGGHTQNARPGVLANRPAPVQVSYLGFPGTLGAGFIDYIVADRSVIPRADAAHFCEKVVCLPDTYLATDSAQALEPMAQARAEAGLPDVGFVFCCFNNSFKVTPRVFDIWMRLLRDVSGSVLWLSEDNSEAVRNLRIEAGRRGIAGERLVFAPRIPRTEHLARHSLADLFLDTLPYNAHSTASDALGAGLPVLTCTGSAFAGRVATSLLQAIGLPELITAEPQAYETRARELARNPEELKSLRTRLALNRQTQPLFDTERFARHLESAYVAMWERAERSQAPADIEVPAIFVRGTQ